MLGFLHVLKPIKRQYLLEKEKNWPHCVLHRCRFYKIHFSEKNILGLGALKTEETGFFSNRYILNGMQMTNTFSARTLSACD